MTTKIRLLHDTVGIPTGAVAVTQSASDNTTKVATTAYVTTALANLADSAPSTLNTLNELAAALGDDANFSTTVTNSIAAKLPLAGGTMTGTLKTPNLTINDGVQEFDKPNVKGFRFLHNDAGNDLSIQQGDTNNANYVTKLNISTDGKVGIGTSSPSRELELKATTPRFRITDTDGGYSEISGSGGHLSFSADAGNTQGGSRITFDIDGSEHMRLASSGNVGIGMSDPDANLEVRGTTVISTASDGVNSILMGLSGTNRTTIQLDTADTTHTNRQWGLTNIAGDFYIGRHGLGVMAMLNNGNVGIGTASPGTSLQIGDGTGDEYITIDKSATGTSGILFKNAGNNKGKILLNSNEELEFYTNNTTKALQIFESGLSTFTGPASSVNLGGGSTGSAALYVNSTSGHTGEMLQILKNGSTRMHMSNDGKLGIGTASPNAPLEINGGVGMSGGWGRSLLLRHPFPVLVFQSEYSTDAYGAIGYDNSTGMHFRVNSSTIDPFSSGNTTAMFIRDDQNVGIGTTSPSAKLYVSGKDDASGASDLLALQFDNSPADTGITFRDIFDGIKSRFTIDSSNTNDLRISSGTQIHLYGGTSNGTGDGHLKINSSGHFTSVYGMIVSTATFAEVSNVGFGSYNSGAWVNSKSGTNGWLATAGNGVLRWSSGNVYVNGALSKNSGSFKIPHPLPSKNSTHALVHSFIEGPQADNIYRGVVDLVNGTATINIDTVSGMTEGTYVLLNTNTSCFTSNETNWDAVKGSVSGNILTINCQNSSSTATVSWLVIGERHDQHMKDTDWTDSDGKVIVEPLKEEEVNLGD